MTHFSLKLLAARNAKDFSTLVAFFCAQMKEEIKGFLTVATTALCDANNAGKPPLKIEKKSKKH